MLSDRVRYALQLLGDLEEIGCCNLGAMAERYRSELSFDRTLVKKVAARLALWGILRYEPGMKIENLFLTVSPVKIRIYSLISAVDREVDFNDLNANKIPHSHDLLKDITVQHLIDAEYMIRKTTIRQDAAGRIRLALERDHKKTLGVFMSPSHTASASILDDRSRRSLFKQSRTDQLRELIERIEAGGKEL